MACATYESDGVRGVAEVHGDTPVPLTGLREIGIHTAIDILAAAPRSTTAIAAGSVALLPVAPNPSKILCVPVTRSNRTPADAAAIRAAPGPALGHGSTRQAFSCLPQPDEQWHQAGAPNSVVTR
jgi:hypothetical protein